jgi:UDP-3-O-[3-hydroxymyristoyl] glucosamine N-acyltransferase
VDIYGTNVDASAVINSVLPLPASVIIGPHAVIEKGVSIGEDTEIGPGVYIGPNVTIGKRCFIGANVCIGKYGFKYSRDEDGVLRRAGYVGVIIGDDVEIDPLTSIHPGHYAPTIIWHRTKIDGLVHIGHDNHIGEDCVIAAGTILGGVVTIEDKCNLGVNVTVKPRVKILMGTRIGSGAVVTKNFEFPNLILAGNPADTIEDLVSRRQAVARMIKTGKILGVVQ